MNDPDFVADMEEARREAERRGEKPPKGHSIRESSPEVREMRLLRQEMRNVRSTVMGIMGSKKQIPPVEMDYRTAVQQIQHEARKRKHEALVARMIPKGPRRPRPEQPTPHPGSVLQTR